MKLQSVQTVLPAIRPSKAPVLTAPEVSSFSLDANYCVQVPPNSDPETLSQVQQQKDRDFVLRRMTQAVGGARSLINELRTMDGSTVAVKDEVHEPRTPAHMTMSGDFEPTNYSMEPREPGFLRRLVDWNAQSEYEQKMEKYRHWQVGGKDLNQRPGIVITMPDVNRHGVAGELRYDPSKIGTPSQLRGGHSNYFWPRGVHSAHARSHVTRDEEARVCREGESGIWLLRELDFQSGIDQDKLKVVTTIFENPEQGRRGARPTALIPGRENVAWIVVDKKNHTLTFAESGNQADPKPPSFWSDSTDCTDWNLSGLT